MGRVYIVPGFTPYAALLRKHKTAKSCLYIKRLSDIDMGTLETLVQRSVKEVKRCYPA
jgi:hypothetical protein